MKSSAEKRTTPLDIAKWVIAVGLLGSGVAAFYLLPAELLLYRVGGLLAALLLGVAIVATSKQGKALWAFAQGSKQEVRKVIWPTRQETLQTTLIVMVVVILVAIFLWLMDLLLLWLVGIITGHGG